MKDTVSNIIAYESGEMPEEDVVPFFQSLVDSGMAWKLQGSYGRAAVSLIEQGLVKPTTPLAQKMEENA